jgi:hypothetical protein
MKISDPHEIAALYGRAHDSCTAALAAGVLPRDIEATWPNVLGFLRRIPGQPYHRPPPCREDGTRPDDRPTGPEMAAFAIALKIHKRRADAAMEVTRS